MLSLRQTAWISGGISALISVSVGTYLLYSFLDQRVIERFDRNLADRHTQIIVALSNTPDDPGALGDLIFDPAYTAPFSGHYWQVEGPDGTIHASASLPGAVLPRVAETFDGLGFSDATGPEVEEVRIAHQRITLEDGSRWQVAVAESLSELRADRQETRRSLILAFGLVALLGMVSVLLQTAAISRPLNKLREDVARRWERDEDLSPADYPEEVAPLVADINTLLERNRDIVGRSRRQAADLAHALKTPSAILRNELALLSAQTPDLDKAVDALDRLDAQLSRSLARIRLSNTGETTQARTDLSHSVARFARLFDTMSGRDGKTFTSQCDPGLGIRIDTQDFEEVLGNLLENALKWAKSAITLSVHRGPDGIDIRIEDDGPGIAEADRTEALRAGVRLDSSKPGTGLGLAIATDLLQAYGATLALEKSPNLGGLSVRIALPSRLVR